MRLGMSLDFWYREFEILDTMHEKRAMHRQGEKRSCMGKEKQRQAKQDSQTGV